MPFFYELHLPPGSPRYRIVRILETSEQYQAAGKKLALLEESGRQFYLISTKPGLLSRWHVAEGAFIDESTKLARIVGDGDDMPYGTYPLVQEV